MTEKTKRSKTEVTVKLVKDFENALNRHSISGNQEKLRGYVKKLYAMPITVTHLQQTRIARCVKEILKRYPDMQNAGQALLDKWKNLVAKDTSEKDPEFLKSREKFHLLSKLTTHATSATSSASLKHVKKPELPFTPTLPSDVMATEISNSIMKELEVAETNGNETEELAEVPQQKSSETAVVQSVACEKSEIQKKRKHPSNSHKIIYEIDNQSGQSFADALSQISTSTHKPKRVKVSKKPESVPPPIASSPASSLSSSSSRSLSSSSSSSSSESSLTSASPQADSVFLAQQTPPPEPTSSPNSYNGAALSSNNGSLFSNHVPVTVSTAPNSCLPRNRPSFPFSVAVPKQPYMKREIASSPDNDQFLQNVTSSKSTKTKMYSGLRSFLDKVPTLIDLCRQVLRENINCFGYTGGVPYDILKPILLQATSEQLKHVESYNEYLMDETDELWEFHCKKQFPKQHMQYVFKLTKWRDIYNQCFKDREMKLKSVTANIKKSIDKAAPQKQTKLALIDPLMAKSRKNKGVIVKPMSLTTAQKIATKRSAENVTAIVPVPATVTNFCKNNIIKPKPAPLMKKALQMMKGRPR